MVNALFMHVFGKMFAFVRFNCGGISRNSDYLSCLSGASLEERDRKTRKEQSTECVSLSWAHPTEECECVRRSEQYCRHPITPS